MANISQLITIPDNYIWDQKQATEELARVLEAAAAGKTQPYVPGTRSITDTIRSPQEMAALYPTNAMNEAVGLAGATGYKVPGSGGKSLFDLLTAGDQMAAGKWQAGPATAVMQSLTGETPSEIALRNAQTRKYNAEAAAEGPDGGLGKSTAAADIINSIGTDQYDNKLTTAIANNQITLLQAQKIEGMKKARTLTDKQLEGFNFAETAYNKLEKLSGLYDETTAAKTGKMSADLQLALATAGTPGAVAAEKLTALMPKLTAADRAFVAQYNLLGLDLRGLANDTRFSNFDAERALRALGNPAVGSQLYKKQLDTVLDDIASKQNIQIKNLETTQGKRLGNIRRLQSREDKMRPQGIPGTYKLSPRTSKGRRVWQGPGGADDLIVE